MEYLNVARAGGRSVRRSEVEPLVAMIAPFAPHLAEELWERLGYKESIFAGVSWPTYDEKLALADQIDIAVQVNGRLRQRGRRKAGGAGRGGGAATHGRHGGREDGFRARQTHQPRREVDVPPRRR
jgi:leucyl-tRNA synthetase